MPHNYLSGRRSVMPESCVSYHTALGYTVEMLDRIRTAAHDVGRIAVVEVPGYQSGWLALQAGMAVCADAVLIPEVRYDLRKLVAMLSGKQGARPVGAVVVIAEGATPIGSDAAEPWRHG